MKRNFLNSLMGACLALCSLGVNAQGLQGVVVENFHTTNQADADYYNGLGNGSGVMTPGLTTYRVYIDMAPGYKLNTVFGSAGNVMDITSTSVFWNDDGFGAQFPPQTSRHDDGSAFDSWITIGRASRSGGAAGCTSNLETLGVLRAADPDATTTHCTTLWSGFGAADKDGSVNGASADPTLVGIPQVSLAPFTDVDGGNAFSTTGAWSLLPPLDGPEAAGANRILIGQFTTAGTFSFHINISLQSPAQQVEFYTHTTSESGSTVSPFLTYPLVLPPDCEGTPGGPAQPGTACNDNNPLTGNDTWSANCVCAGLVIDCEGTPGGAALPGTACNDNNPLTGNDTWSANCVCAGLLIDCEGTPGGAALPGTACNDNNPNTGNDTWSANCVCAGLVIDCEGTPGGAALPGTACNDNNPNTGNDTWSANCVCVGLVIDCEGTPGGAALPGTACNDNNPLTGNDTWSANCVCAGLVIDCEGTPAGAALPGTACNDNNPLTGNDTWSANCVCAGLVIDCEGTPGGAALPGTACNDLNPNTSNDTWSANCVCAGVLPNDCEGTPGGPAQPGTACNDNNPLTGNDTWSANCVCAGLVIDCEGTPGGAALPGTACNDLNPNTSNDTWSANCVCAGVLANDCEGTPGGPAQPGTACNDNNPLTGNDTWSANCVCAGLVIDCEGTPGGAALPGTACNDNNPLTGNDTWSANCVCAGLVIDCEGTPGGAELPGTACNDNNPLTGNDTWSANCVCAGLVIDCEGTPGGAALPGTACNDNNANTENDIWSANCVCAGTPIGGGCNFNEVEIAVVNDAVSIVSYEVRVQGTNVLAANGTVNPPAGLTVQDICLPDGCYYLIVSDNGGDGIVDGGYVLRLAAGARLIDNAGNMTVSPSQITANEGFCLPLGVDRLIGASCDKLDWRTAPCVAEYVVANANPLVSAQYGVTNTTSGYQMWWYNPNGGYSFKRTQFHSTANGLSASATRACHFKINAWGGNQIAQGVLLNVKVRGIVNGAFQPWGAACRFRVDNTAAQCPLARLNDIAGNQFFSCGVTRPVAVNAYVHATPVRRMLPSCAWQNANRYQFRFRIAAESFELVKTSTTYFVNTLGLSCGKTYDVDVRASFDGGATWCATGETWGVVCTVSTVDCFGGSELGMTTTVDNAASLLMYPNPNRGDQLFVSIGSIEEGVETVSVDIYDAFGKRVSARTIATQDGFVNSVVELNGDLSAGFYLVNVTAGSASWSERLVVQP